MKKILRLAGVVISLLGIAFVAHALASQWSATTHAIANADGVWLAVAVVCGAAGMTWIAAVWAPVLTLVGAPIQMTRAISLYFQGEVGKYVPGGIWSVLGRGELARREGVGAAASYASVVFSLGGLYMACALVAAGALPWAADAKLAPVAIVVVVAGLIALHPRVLGVGKQIAQKLTRREIGVDIPPWGRSLQLVVLYVPVWLLIGSATWSIVHALGGRASWPEVCFATALSWLVGFLAVVVPGGIGVREAVFVGALPALSRADAAAAAVLARVLFMAVDGLGALIAWLVSRKPAAS